MPEGGERRDRRLAHRGGRARWGHAEGWHRFLEILEVGLLAIVAIVTVWSGFQAAKWDGRQSVLYGHSSRTASRPRPPLPAATNASPLTPGSSPLAAGARSRERPARDPPRQATHPGLQGRVRRVARDRSLRQPLGAARAGGNAAVDPGCRGRHRLMPPPATPSRGNESPWTGAEVRARHRAVRDALFLVAIAQRMKDKTLRGGVNLLAVRLAVYGVFSVVRLPRL